MAKNHRKEEAEIIIDVDPDAIEEGWEEEIEEYNRTIKAEVEIKEDHIFIDGIPIQQWHEKIVSDPEGFFGEYPETFSIDGIGVTVKIRGEKVYDEYLST